MGVKHSVSKVSGDRGYAAEWNADHVIDGNVDCQQYQLIEHVLENRTTWPAGPVAGQVIYRTDLGTFYFWNGTNWVPPLSPRRSDTLIVAAADSLDATRADYVCDGANDEVEINAAIAALPSYGGRVLLLEGHYNIGDTVYIDKSYVSLVGNGAGTVLVATGDSSYGVVCVRPSVDDVFGVELAHFAVDGAAVGRGIYLLGSFAIGKISTGVRVHHCIVHGSVAYGIYDTGPGAPFSPAVCNDISNNEVYGCASTAVMSVNTSSRLVGNHVHDNAMDGISPQLSSGPNVSLNRVYNNGRNGIRLRGTVGAIAGLNRVYNNSQAADNTYDEIVVEYAGDDNIVTGNSVRCDAANKARYGIFIENAVCDNNVVTSNRVTGAATANIQDNGTGTTLAGNNVA